MKLSKAQQEVVDKMREGWELKKDGAGVYLYHETVGIQKVRDSTQNALYLMDVISCVPGPEPPYANYQLTEKYRSNEK